MTDFKRNDFMPEKCTVTLGRDCLNGMKEHGCNSPVTTALDSLKKHLNQAAHDEEM